MRARSELPHVGEVEVVRHEESTFALSGGPDLRVTLTAETFSECGVDVEPESSKPRSGRLGDVLVELELQATFASGGIGLGAGRSSAADAAAKAITARRSSSPMLGNSFRIDAADSPGAR